MAVEERCPYCNASMKKYWYKITPGLIVMLRKFYKNVIQKGENKLIRKDLDLSNNEYINFTKLRFHALIAKYKQGGQRKEGIWLVTKRAAQFLHGKISIPRRVLTFRNKVVGYSRERVNIKDVMKSVPYLETDFNYEVTTYNLFPEEVKNENRERNTTIH